VTSIRSRQLAHALAATAATVAVGTVGFMLILEESFIDALYRTAVTMTTVGLATLPDTWGAKAFTIVLAFAGVAIFLYIVGLVTELVVSGVVGGALQERRVRHRVEELTGHYIVCGYGRVGQEVAAALRAAAVSYVVVERAPATIALAEERGELVVHGSAADDDVLSHAGLDRARGLVACLDSDANNVYVVLTARGARPDLQIAARASEEDAVQKLRRAGADRVVSPYQTAGRELATMLLRPQVAAFLDNISGAGIPEFQLEQIEVKPDCGHVGRSISELRVREVTGAMIIAHRRGDGSFNTRPDPGIQLEAGDVLIGVGTSDEIRALEELFGARETIA
jgi:voltage-gated potassium channel